MTTSKSIERKNSQRIIHYEYTCNYIKVIDEFTKTVISKFDKIEFKCNDRQIIYDNRF